MISFIISYLESFFAVSVCLVIHDADVSEWKIGDVYEIPTDTPRHIVALDPEFIDVIEDVLGDPNTLDYAIMHLPIGMKAKRQGSKQDAVYITHNSLDKPVSAAEYYA